MTRILFVCLHNAGRSQMSEALFSRAARGRHEARSAGTEPGDRVHPEVVEAMDELGIELADGVPRKLSHTDAEWAAGEAALRHRGLLDDSGTLTDAGSAMRQRVEQRTDELMLPALETLGDEDAARLVELVRPLSRRIVGGGGVPVPNPMGASDPE